jgi:DNA-binding transcriptional LysR family regulator
MPNRPNSLDLALVHAFVHTTDIGSISRAAPGLDYSQPGLSQRLQALERLIGTPLLIRRPNGVQPTSAGHAALPHARTLLAVADTLRHVAQQAHQVDPGSDEPGPTHASHPRIDDAR